MADRTEPTGTLVSRAAALVDEADRRRRAAIIKGIVSAVAMLAGLVVGHAWLGTRPSQESVVENALVAVMSLYLLVPIVGLYVARLQPGSGGLAVWSRRFARSRRKKLAFDRVLLRACAGIATPVTIQDRSVRTSFIVGVTRAWFVFPAVLIAWIFVPSLVLIGQIEKAISISGYRDPPWWYPLVPSSENAFMISLVIWSPILGFLLWSLVKRMGFRSSVGKRAQRSAAARFDALQKRGRVAGVGIEVVRCDDQNWQGVFEEALQRATLVVVDLSEPSKAIRWELTRAFDRVAPERILFACHRARDEGEPILRVVQELTAAGITRDPAWIEGAVFTYPEWHARGLFARRREQQRVAAQLRAVIARCLSV